MTAAIFQGCTICLNPKLERQFTMPYIPVEPERIGTDIQQRTQQILDRNDGQMIEIHKILGSDVSKPKRSPIPPPKPHFQTKPQFQTQQQYQQQQCQQQPQQNVRQTQGYYYPPPQTNVSNPIPRASSNPVPKAVPASSRSSIQPKQVITGIVSGAFNFGKGIVEGVIHGGSSTPNTNRQDIPARTQYKYCSKCKSTNPITATTCSYCQSHI